MPGPMSAPNGHGPLTINGTERRKKLQSNQLYTGKTAGENWRKDK